MAEKQTEVYLVIDGVKLQEANSGLKTIDIEKKGKVKKYVMVNERLNGFRKVCPDGQIVTEILSITPDAVTIRAAVMVDGVTLATGTAYEERQSSYINQSSYVENCETSAVGRALGFLGIGIDDSMASADEVANAMVQQAAIKAREVAALTISSEKAQALAARCLESDIDVIKLCKIYNVSTFYELTEAKHSNIINHWDKVVESCKRQAK